jgi:hypothetical protein
MRQLNGKALGSSRTKCRKIFLGLLAVSQMQGDEKHLTEPLSTINFAPSIWVSKLGAHGFGGEAGGVDP